MQEVISTSRIESRPPRSWGAAWDRQPSLTGNRAMVSKAMEAMAIRGIRSSRVMGLLANTGTIFSPTMGPRQVAMEVSLWLLCISYPTTDAMLAGVSALLILKLMEAMPKASRPSQENQWCLLPYAGGGGYGAPQQAARPGMGAGTAGMLGAGGGLLGGMMLGEAMEQ